MFILGFRVFFRRPRDQTLKGLRIYRVSFRKPRAPDSLEEKVGKKGQKSETSSPRLLLGLGVPYFNNTFFSKEPLRNQSLHFFLRGYSVVA